MKTNAVDFSQECPCIWKIQINYKIKLGVKK